MRETIVKLKEDIERLQKMTLALRADLPISASSSHSSLRYIEQSLDSAATFVKSALQALEIEVPQLLALTCDAIDVEHVKMSRAGDV